MRAVLIGSSGLVLGREYALDAPVVTIGRRDENTIVIKDPTVSRKHAEIRRDGDSYLIADKGSTSGITVNGQLISGEQSLRDGDRIGIGSSAVFLIQLQPTEDKTISFAQQQYAEQGRTQFITREIGDPRALSSSPEVQRPAEPPRQEPVRQEPPRIPAAPPPPERPAQASPPRQESPSFAPPPQQPSYSPPAQSWNEPPRREPSGHDFAPRPSVDFNEPPLAPPTMQDMPRSRPDLEAPRGFTPPPGGRPDLAPRFDAPSTSPAHDLPPMSAVSEFAPNPPGSSSNPSNPILGAPPQFSAPPSFSQPPGAPGGAMMAPPPPPTGASARGGRGGLIVALIIVMILVIMAAVVVGLLLTGRLG